MKRIILLQAVIILFLGTIPVFAQVIDVFNGTSSAGMLGSQVKFNCDFFDPIGIPGVGIYVNYKGQSDDDYYQREMQLMDEFPYYISTYEYDQYFDDPPGLMNFYFCAGNDTLKATQSPENTDNIFPPPSYLYAPLSTDASGDAENPAGDWLDLTGSGICYSDTRVYVHMENVSGTWPTSQGLNAFIYAIGFVSLNDIDSTMYALVYGNIPLVISPGLYKLTLADTSFTRLGDADYTVANGQLHLACDIADFENDPNWPGWPPPSGFLVTMGISLTAGFTQQALNDYTYPSVFVPKTQYVDFDNNTPPEIIDYRVESVPGVTTTVKADYYDVDNNLPLTRILYFDWGFYDMASFDHTYADTSEFEKILAWPGEGWHYYRFRFSDGVETVETPMDSVYLTLTDIEDNSSLPVEFSLYQNYPNPFNGSTVITFNLPQPGQVNLTIYDILGREIVSLADETFTAGSHTITWNAENGLSSGIYFYRLKANDEISTQQMVYIK